MLWVETDVFSMSGMLYYCMYGIHSSGILPACMVLWYGPELTTKLVPDI